MAEKGNERSNAKISDDDIYRILQKKGRVKVFSNEYKAFTTGKSNIDDNEERLFLCDCTAFKNGNIPSPLNYTGGKFKLLPQLLPLFPKKIDKAVDLFCGGCNVGINLKCNDILLNDNSSALMGLLELLKTTPKNIILDKVNEIIQSFGLSQSTIHDYSYYNCSSQKGLGDYNREPFNCLRTHFNKLSSKDSTYYLTLYVLIVYAFNNQIRFNNKGEFNLPVGKRDFNDKMQRKLALFIDRIQEKEFKLSNVDFKNFDLSGYSSDSFFYIDPPYLITCATYNEKNGWTEQDELELLKFLDRLDSKKIKFALSNVLESKGRTNLLLTEWVKSKKGRYIVHDLDYSYSNANYHAKNKDKKTREVLIVNYEEN